MKKKIRHRKKMILVDCSHICYVVFFGLKEEDRSGKNVIIYGFLKRILQIMEEFRTSDLVFFWDSPTSIRKQRHSFYKDARKKSQKIDPNMPNMHKQRNELKEVILPAIGFNAHVEVDGYEADDTMASMVEKNHHIDFYIIANDNDLFQILKNDNLKGIFSCSNNVLTTRSDFMSKYRIHPKDWHLYKAICGCKTDEVSGVKGVGNKYTIDFIRGELNPISKPYKCIVNQQDVVIRNLWLVTLPLKGLRRIKFKVLKNTLHKGKFSTIEKLYRITFTEGWEKWAK